MDNWIKVEDRLPELPNDPGWGEEVIAATSDGKVIEARFARYHNGELHWTSVHQCRGAVTHWMPYPKHPGGN